MKLLVILCIFCVSTTFAIDKLPKIKDKDMLRKMIIYDKVWCLNTLKLYINVQFLKFYRKIQTFSTVQHQTQNTKFQLTRWLLSRHSTIPYLSNCPWVNEFIYLLLLELIQSASCVNMRVMEYLRTVNMIVTRTLMRQILHARRNIELW